MLPPDAEFRPLTRPATRVVGILGGIASGKSRAAALLAGPEGRILDADRIAHGALASPEVARRVAEAFGPEVLGPDGRPDRAALAREVFADPEARRRLEGWIHPVVRATIADELKAARAARVPLVVLDVPLLLENEAQHGLAAECDALVFVDTPAADREARARATRGWDEQEVARREATQLPLESKRARATHVLDNSGSPEQLEARARLLRAELLASPSG